MTNEENHADFGVREVTVILWWSFTLNHNMEVGNSLIKKEMRVENYPPLCLTTVSKLTTVSHTPLGVIPHPNWQILGHCLMELNDSVETQL